MLSAGCRFAHFIFRPAPRRLRASRRGQWNVQLVDRKSVRSFASDKQTTNVNALRVVAEVVKILSRIGRDIVGRSTVLCRR